MYKFKFDPPIQNRRSLHPPKNDHIALLNTLDKCTQILREDRLWLRTQIKGNNQDVIALFKQFSRGTQLGQLQVKLRKYVQNVKNKIKQQQLIKFRQTLNATQNIHHQPQKSNTINKRNSTHHSKSHLKSSSSSELNKTTNFRPNKSQEHQQVMRSTSSFRHFQDLLKYKYQQQAIEERQSQNVTSARLGRQQNEQNQSQPLQELKYNSNHQNYNNFFANKLDIKPYQPTKEQTHKWEFQKKAKQVLYEYEPESRKQQEIEQSRHGYVSRKHQEIEQREQSIFDQHFNESEKMSNHQESSLENSIKQFKNVQFGQSNYQERDSLPKHGFSLQQFDLKQSKFSSIHQSKLKVSQPEPSDEQNLFTPQDLLMECRNFLKNRESSVKKQYTSHRFEDFLKQEPVIQVEASKVEPTKECIFSRDNHQQSSIEKPEKLEPRHEQKKQEETYFFPSIGNSEEQSLETTNKKPQVFNYPQFETFANSSMPKISFEKAAQQSEAVSLNKQKVKEILPSLPADFSIEDFIEDLMEITEMNPFITVQNLNKYITIQSNHKAFKNAFSSLQNQDSNSQICLTKIAELLNKAFNEQHQVSYPHCDASINSVYDLLDIDQKGHISRQDIESFLNQIEQAEVQNFDEVSQELIRLFDGADFTNEQKLTYWHFYLVKNSEQFQKVSQLLGEFEFEIQRDC